MNDGQRFTNDRTWIIEVSPSAGQTQQRFTLASGRYKFKPAANGIAFLIFVLGRQVAWRYCLVAMVACAIGGYMSARFARVIPQPVLRGLVIAIGFGMAGWYFYKTSF